MFQREEVLAILNAARRIDENCEMFGASKHRYLLNPPIRKSFVRGVEERYGFKLPEDYFDFITEVGDGGAGPDYGITPFVELVQKGQNTRAEAYAADYRRSLAKEFTPRSMRTDEVDEYAIVTKEYYEKNPEQYFVYDKFDDDNLCITNGFFVLGTHGCQWDFGMVVSGERRGQIFDMDNEGAYGFAAYSFAEFYQNWLDRISDKEWFLKELAKWKKSL